MSECTSDNDRLRQWFDGQGMTRTALAERLGVSLAYVSMILNGKRQVQASVRGLFADAFGYATAAQVFGDNAETSDSIDVRRSTP